MKSFALIFIFILTSAFWYAGEVGAAENNYVTFVSIVRGPDYWRMGGDIKFFDQQKQTVDQAKIPNTWLVQYDAFLDPGVLSRLKNLKSEDEVGLFMEVSHKQALASFVKYDWNSEKWERADKVFLSGYTIAERKRLVDTAFFKYLEVFGIYPKSVGAWHIDGWSLSYMKEKYGIETVLGLSDQYSTDGYQEWGQYVGQPYYPSRLSVIEPAENEVNKIDVVKLQWAPREPLLSYGDTPEFSNYSVQVNDYFRYHKLGREYISKLLQTYTLDVAGKIAQVTLGIEVGELEEKYWNGLKQQLDVVMGLNLKPTTMTEFARAYDITYPQVSPSITINSGIGNRHIQWFMTTWYRAGVIREGGKYFLVDMRFYNTSRISENDQYSSDSNHTLHRVVPAVIDKVVLKNEIQLKNGEFGFADDRIALPVLLSRELEEYLMDQGLGVARSADGNTFIFPNKQVKDTLLIGKVSFPNKLRQLIGLFIPDLRYSRLDGKMVFGIKTGPETLWGINFKDQKLGKLYFQYPVLEDFINLDKYRYPNIEIYGRWEDELEIFQAKGEVIKKSFDYGWDNVANSNLENTSFENSLYIVRHK
jgi:hypothetical protein